MQPDTDCSWCLFPLTLCPYHSELSEIPSTDFTASDIGTTELPVVEDRHLLANNSFPFMQDLLSVLEEGDMSNPIGLRGPSQWQPPPPTVSGVGSARPPPQPVVASPAQISAAHRRRTNPSSRRFICGLCLQDFTEKHNLRNHINSHLKRKGHKCGSCGKGFATRSSSIRHSKKCRWNTMAPAE